jgi:hypothetical protein
MSNAGITLMHGSDAAKKDALESKGKLKQQLASRC